MKEIFTSCLPKDIEALNSDQLVQLLHRLLHCEARQMALNQHGILVPFQITVADGGSDGEWRLNDSFVDYQHREYIPRRWTRYQCKAQHLTEKMCRDEVVNKKSRKISVKSRVREVLEAGGCFAFFTTGHEVKSSKKADIDTVVRRELEKADFVPHKDARIEFYGCNRIAAWVNKFPAAVMAVKEMTKGIGGIHYYTFNSWGNQTCVTGEYFGSNTSSHKIASLKDALLSGAKRLIRVTGLSGLGKTRIVYEAFSQYSKGNPSEAALTESCIYISYSDISTELIQLISYLSSNELEAIIVVDDCPSDIHNNIANKIGNSNLKVITIYHEPQELRSDTLCIELDPGEMKDVVTQIIKKDPQLSSKGDDAINAVASFAQGFPQMAKLICELKRAPSVKELNDRSSIIKKLLYQGDTADKNIIRIAQILSLFKIIGGSGKKYNTDLKSIREIFCPDISEYDFNNFIYQQKQRKIVQQIGDTLFLGPRPLAVALAIDYISIYPKEKWREVIEKIKEDRLISEFLSRIEELEFSREGEEIGKMFLEIGLPFNNAEYLIIGRTGSQIFRTLTVLCPTTAIKVLKKSLIGCSIAELRDAKEARRELVHALELLVWQEETFQDAAELLLRFAAAENEGWANNATGVFMQLFHLYLSGTKVPAISRLEIIKKGVSSDEPDIRKVVIEAVGAGLNFSHYTRMGDRTLAGKRDPKYDWKPDSKRQELDYWKECFHILYREIAEETSNKLLALESLGRHFSVILQTPLILELEDKLVTLTQLLNNFWPEVKNNINQVLNYNKNINNDHKEALVRLKERLTPKIDNIELKLSDVVSTPGWHGRVGKDGKYIDESVDEAKELASSLAKRKIDIIPYLSQLLSGEQQQGFSFGSVIGKEHPNAQSILAEIIHVWPNINPDKRNVTFFNGLMYGLASRRDIQIRTLEQLASDLRLTDLLAAGTAYLNVIEERDFTRIKKVILESQIELSRLQNLVHRLPLRGLSSTFIIKEISIILEARPELAKDLLNNIFSYCFDEPEKFKEFRILFQKLILTEGLILSDTHTRWQWKEVAIKLVKTSNNNDWIKLLSQYICNILIKKNSLVDNEYYGNVVAELFSKAPQETWTSFGQILETGTDVQKYIMSEFLGKSSNHVREADSPLWNLPEVYFNKWIKNNTSLAPLILNSMNLYTVEKDTDEQEVFNWHPHALSLLNVCTDEDEIERALYCNLYSFSSIGSRIPYLEKRKALVKKLYDMGDQKLIRIAQKMDNFLDDEIEKTQRYELNEQARWG